MCSDQSAKPSIIVDEDWKSRVEAEKAVRTEDEPSPVEPRVPSGEPASAAAAHPPATFEALASLFVAEALCGLGLAPNPMNGKVERNLPQARYAIDMLDMLADKTRGNLSSSEEQGLHALLHQQRMGFLGVEKKEG
jgi:hypothetical protein